MSGFGISGMPGIHFNTFAQTAKTSQPDWRKIPHKGMERPSDAEFEVIIDNLAKELAEARYNNNHSKYEKLSSAAEKMRAQYISSVSPDRKNMVKETFQLMKQSRSSSQKKASDEPKTLIDYLIMKDGLGDYAAEGRWSATANSGTTIVFTGSDLQPNTFEIKGSKLGQAVMGYAAGNWYYVNTPQEQKMQQTFLTRLNSAEERYYRQYISSELSSDKLLENSIASMQSSDRLNFLV